MQQPRSRGIPAERRGALLIRVERVSEAPMLVLALVFLLVTVLPVVTPLSPDVHRTLELIGWLIWGIFTVELSIKTYLAPDRWRYLVQHWPDVLMVVLPFLRPLRLIRVIVSTTRIWRHTRYLLRTRTLSLIGVTCLIALMLGSTLVFIAERGAGGPLSTFADALWWATTTITTVGYGDVYPITAAGRGVAVALMLTGISIFGLLTARIAATFVEDTQPAPTPEMAELLARLRSIEARLADLQGQPSEDQ